MNFFESIHCQSKAHCHHCRDKEGGKFLRESFLNKFDDIKSNYFECPNDLQWGEEKQLIVIQPNLYPSMQTKIEDRIKELPVNALGQWCTRMISQCYATMTSPPAYITCKTRRHFINRCKDKMNYYFDLALSPTTNSYVNILKKT